MAKPTDAAPKKPAKAKAAKPAALDLRAMGLETYEAVRMHRGALKSAPYNPRVLNDKERAALRRGVRKHGLVAPPTWNRRTGNVVGGHQRLAALDAAAGTSNYELTVAVIDVDEARERELNILLNNPNAQGDWDLEKLGALFRDESVKVDIAGTGFDTADVFKLFGDSPFETRADDLAAMAEKLREVVEQTDAGRDTAASRDSAHFYLVVVFKDDQDRVDFTEALGLEDNRYVDGRWLRALLGKPHPDDVETPVSAADDAGDDEDA